MDSNVEIYVLYIYIYMNSMWDKQTLMLDHM